MYFLVWFDSQEMLPRGMCIKGHLVERYILSIMQTGESTLQGQVTQSSSMLLEWFEGILSKNTNKYNRVTLEFLC